MRAQGVSSQLAQLMSFPLRDPESRRRFAVGCALLLGGFVFPIIPGVLVYGYALRVLRLTATGNAPSMPAWDDWTSMLSTGARATLVQLVYTFPAFTVLLLGAFAYFGTFFLIPLTSEAQSSLGEPAIAIMLLGMLAVFLSFGIGSVLLLAAAIPLPVSVSHFAVTDKLSSAFRVGEWSRILSANKAGYFVSFVVVIGVLGIGYLGFMVLYSTLVLLCLGYLLIVPTSLYAMLVGAALFGEAYREGAESLRLREAAA